MYLGIEFGSTNIKAVKVDDMYNAVETASYGWKSSYDNGIWTYSLDEAKEGLCHVLSEISCRDRIKTVGISAMMHGYLAFDKNWNLLVPFRTWQNTVTEEAAIKLTNIFGFNIPQRWSVAHLYQAILNREPHIKDIAHITTLSAYIHFMLTGENVIGIGDASGMFPIDSNTNDYDADMVKKFDKLLYHSGLSYTIRDILPKILLAGESAGTLSADGGKFINNLLGENIIFAAPEGDAGTGMVATNSISKKCGNVSAGTSIFAMVVLDKQLKNLHTEIDMVTTPSGAPVAMVHCNNCTNDLNMWVSMFSEMLDTFGNKVSTAELYTILFKKALEGDTDCDRVLCYNYMAGEVITGLNGGVPMILRTSDSKLNLANFMRAMIYGTMATLKLGMDILFEEGIEIDCLLGHGGLFKTQNVSDVFMASALNIPIKCMETAGEGGPYGMALLAAYLSDGKGMALDEFLNTKVFVNKKFTTAFPEDECKNGFDRYMKLYTKGLATVRAAVKNVR